MRHYAARINDRLCLNGLRIVVLENEVLRAPIRADLGCDVTELLHEAKDVDFLWHRPGAAGAATKADPGSSCDRPPVARPQTA